MNFNIEDCQQVPGHPEYFATACGQIISAKRKKLRVLKGGLSGLKREYRHVFTNTNGINKFSSVHRLVCLAFHGLPAAGMEVRHIDGNSMNNAASNLEWATHRENMLDCVKHGTHNRGMRSGAAKLTDAEVRVIRKLRDKGLVLRRIGEIFDISQSHVSAIVTRKQWAHI